MIFPLVPALLAQSFHQTINITQADPRDWSTSAWIILMGPLLGFGFLAGATVGLSDDPGRRGFRAWLSRQAVWVAVGPWIGFVVCSAVAMSLYGVGWLTERLAGPGSAPRIFGDAFWSNVLIWSALVTASYGWLLIAIAAVRRARRAGRMWASLRLGVATSLAFVGSLIGAFWAVTESWRAYFFDTTLVRLLMVATVGTTMMSASGCAGQPTVGDVRRRELFGAMLLAWVVGLALCWRWWARSRPKPPDA
jgi:hypothetical protein